ncbi:MAG: hypothetical protein KatS3mg061_3324 [Dehalococcoidia bacterium]|nr:MAG: hypothetical protein KatS3mg061_3324 [Dehalococcoidia bacterium]
MTARRVPREDELGDPAVFGGIRVGAGEQKDVVRVLGVVPDLGAIEDEIVTIGHRTRPEGGEVGAGIWLRVALRPADLPARDLGQELPLLLFRTVEHDRRADGGNAQVGITRAADAVIGGQFVEERLLHFWPATPAVLHRPGTRQPTPLPQLPLALGSFFPEGGLSPTPSPVGWGEAIRRPFLLAIGDDFVAKGIVLP